MIPSLPKYEVHTYMHPTTKPSPSNRGREKKEEKIMQLHSHPPMGPSHPIPWLVFLEGKTVPLWNLPICARDSWDATSPAWPVPPPPSKKPPSLKLQRQHMRNFGGRRWHGIQSRKEPVFSFLFPPSKVGRVRTVYTMYPHRRLASLKACFGLLFLVFYPPLPPLPQQKRKKIQLRHLCSVYVTVTCSHDPITCTILGFGVVPLQLSPAGCAGEPGRC